jgi:hypothetical protein
MPDTVVVQLETREELASQIRIEADLFQDTGLELLGFVCAFTRKNWLACSDIDQERAQSILGACQEIREQVKKILRKARQRPDLPGSPLYNDQC